jgi:hypothetical protein
VKQRGGSEQGRAAEEKARFENKAQALRPNLNVRFATGAPKQKRTFKILHCESVFNSVLKNNEPLQWFGNAKPLVNEIAAPFVHETCLYAVFEHEAMDRSL